MKTKKEIRFVTPTPDDYSIDYSKAKRLTRGEEEKLLGRASVKPRKSKSKKAA
jgi:hypothetical protein